VSDRQCTFVFVRERMFVSVCVCLIECVDEGVCVCLSVCTREYVCLSVCECAHDMLVRYNGHAKFSLSVPEQVPECGD